MSFDSLTIHFLSLHPLGCPERLEEVPVVVVKERLELGTKLESAGSTAGSEVMLTSNTVALMSIAVASMGCGSCCKQTNKNKKMHWY